VLKLLQKQTLGGLALVGLLVLGACSQPATTSPPSSLSETQSVEVRDKVGALLADWATAGNEGRWKDIPPLFAEDPGFVWVERGEVRYTSRAEAIASLEAVAASGANVETIVPEVAVAPISADSAAFTAPLHFTLTSVGSEPIEVDGVISGVAIKRNGEWKFLQGNVANKFSATDKP